MSLDHKINWANTASDLASTLLGVFGDDATIGAAYAASLNSLGTFYDRYYSEDVNVSKVVNLNAQASALAVWRATTSDSHAQADRVARDCEALQVTANTGAVAQPYLAPDGSILAPSTAIAWADPETPIVAASATFSSKLRINANLPGAVGNDITAAIANATDAVSGHCKLTLSYDSYVEVFDNLDAAAAPTVTSKLGALTWLTASRPTNASASLAGGTGGTHAAILARVDRALTLPAAVAQVNLLSQHRGFIASIGGPSAPYTGIYVRLAIANTFVDGPWITHEVGLSGPAGVVVINGKTNVLEARLIRPTLFLLNIRVLETELQAVITAAELYIGEMA